MEFEEKMAALKPLLEKGPILANLIPVSHSNRLKYAKANFKSNKTNHFQIIRNRSSIKITEQL